MITKRMSACAFDRVSGSWHHTSECNDGLQEVAKEFHEVIMDIETAGGDPKSLNKASLTTFTKKIRRRFFLFAMRNTEGSISVPTGGKTASCE